MNLNLTNKVSVVLGASHGLGRGVATCLAEEGCRIAMCSRSNIDLHNFADELTSTYNTPVISTSLDVSCKVDLENFLDNVLNTFGHIDILVNNGGGPKPSASISLSNDDFSEAYELVLMSKVNATLKVLPSMILRRSGVVINIESTSAKEPLKNMALSNTFRAASLAFAKTVALEHAADGITVKTILTGPFLTRRVEELGKVHSNTQGIEYSKWLSTATENVPLGRFGDPLEFGRLVAFLASEQSLFMTGNSIALDGGVLASM